ncbi:MAG: tetratricopeptide repeat protein, partial [Planctomycetota bacterium]
MLPRRALIPMPLACTLLLVAGCGSPVGHRSGEQPGMRLDTVLLEADTAIESGNREEAIRLLAAAIEVTPDYVPAYARLGELQLEGADYQGAERTYSSLVRLEPRVFDHQYFHAHTLHKLERFTEAVRAYLRALAIDPQSFEAHLDLSTAYLQLTEHAQSLPYARKAVELDPESGRAWANLGASLGAFGSRDTDLEAVRAFENAAELMEITPELLANWATALGRLGRFR